MWVVTNYIKVILKGRGKSYDSCYKLYRAICTRIILKTQKKWNNF